MHSQALRPYSTAAPPPEDTRIDPILGPLHTRMPFAGWLWRTAPPFVSWVRRWHILDSDGISSVPTQADGYGLTRLCSISTVVNVSSDPPTLHHIGSRRPPLKGTPYVFSIHYVLSPSITRSVLFAATTPADRRAWVLAIRSWISQALDVSHHAVLPPRSVFIPVPRQLRHAASHLGSEAAEYQLQHPRVSSNATTAAVTNLRHRDDRDELFDHTLPPSEGGPTAHSPSSASSFVNEVDEGGEDSPSHGAARRRVWWDEGSGVGGGSVELSHAVEDSVYGAPAPAHGAAVPPPHARSFVERGCGLRGVDGEREGGGRGIEVCAFSSAAPFPSPTEGHDPSSRTVVMSSTAPVGTRVQPVEDSLFVGGSVIVKPCRGPTSPPSARVCPLIRNPPRGFDKAFVKKVCEAVVRGVHNPAVVVAGQSPPRVAVVGGDRRRRCGLVGGSPPRYAKECSTPTRPQRQGVLRESSAVAVERGVQQPRAISDDVPLANETEGRGEVAAGSGAALSWQSVLGGSVEGDSVF